MLTVSARAARWSSSVTAWSASLPTCAWPKMAAPPLTNSAPAPDASPSSSLKILTLALTCADFSTAKPPARRTEPSTSSFESTLASVVSATRKVPDGREKTRRVCRARVRTRERARDESDRDATETRPRREPKRDRDANRNATETRTKTLARPPSLFVHRKPPSNRRVSAMVLADGGSVLVADYVFGRPRPVERRGEKDGCVFRRRRSGKNKRGRRKKTRRDETDAGRGRHRLVTVLVTYLRGTFFSSP